MKYKGKLWMAAAALGLCALLGGCSGSTIDQDTALKTALDHAGVAQEDTISLLVEQDKEDGEEVYDIQFATSEQLTAHANSIAVRFEDEDKKEEP